MTANKIVEGLYIVPGFVNVYLLKLPGGLTVIDTGFARDTQKILDGIASIGKRAGDVRHILLTHAHPDHIGGAAALQKVSGAQTYSHVADKPLIETGGPSRPIVAAPGIRNMIVAGLLRRLPGRVEPTHVDHELQEGVAVPFEADLVPVHIPGHCKGQVAFLWNRGGGVLFAADACINRKGMVLAAAQEDVSEARRSLAKLAGYKYEIACFGHGPPILAAADQVFKTRWL